MISTQDISDIVGADAVDGSDDKVGKVGQVYVDADSDQPTWVSVRSGLFGTSESLVPLEGASWDGSALRLSFSKDRVKDAPRVDPDAELSPEEQERLYDYYGLGDGVAGGTTGDRTGTGTDLGATGAGYTAGAADAGRTDLVDTDRSYDADRTVDTGRSTGTEGYDTSGPTTDDAMTRSEERLNVGTQKVETGRARLRKFIVTDQQTVTVPVSHDEVRIEREPITDANRGAATSGPDLSEEEHEVVLTEERPVVSKETVAVERVRLGTETVTEQQQVTEDVRHEEITTDDDTTGRTAR